MPYWKPGLAGIAIGASLTFGHPAQADDTLYHNAMIWNGDAFQAGSLAIRDGMFIAPSDLSADAERIDLNGAHIVPPYGNAHHHITYASEASSWGFVDPGVFYVWNPNTVTPSDAAADATFYAQRGTYDVSASMGGITEPFGHPERLYVEQLSQYVYQGWELPDFLGNAFHYGRTEGEIDAALDLLLEQGAGFVKTYLLYSEDYGNRANQANFYGQTGLNPENFPYLVEAAHARGLPVAVHVQTRYDAVVAARAGADMLAHLPAYSLERTEQGLAAVAFTEEEAAILGASGIVVVPTYLVAKRNSQYLPEERRPTQAQLDALHAVQAENLRRLHAAGVPILTGTDGPQEVVTEIEHWVDIGGLSRGDALDELFATPAHLFPQRRIGVLEPGYEASFLALNGDPLADLSALGDIALRIKQGEVMTGPVTDAEPAGTGDG
ncbi:amidohydrolase family protein [Maricaulis sp.]|uniref:amidohydrolase family protein n=1 Tax=Maricaulis sp. TaxID=1486257 RepID=UPI002621D576|nr:amidohydrolase family protein [Maricaulis sp.]